VNKIGKVHIIKIDFFKVFDLVQHDQLLTKIASLGVDSRVVVWLREFLFGRTHSVRVGGQLLEDVRVMSGGPQGCKLGPLLFLTCDIWRNNKSNIRFFADNCIIYRKIVINNENLLIDLNRLGDCIFENETIINSTKSKAVFFMRAQVTVPLNYSLWEMVLLEAISCKYLGVILCSDLIWADQVNYTVKKACNAILFTMRILKNGNSYTKSVAYTSLVHQILECRAACWDPYREGKINVLDQLQNQLNQNITGMIQIGKPRSHM
jgi:hypothetical protein